MPDNVIYAPPPMPPMEAPDAAADKKDVPPGLISQVLQIPIRRWQATASILLISAAIGAGVGFVQKKNVYTISGNLSYPKTEPNERLKPYYRPDSKDTLAKLIMTTDNLQRLIDEFKLDMGPTTLNRFIKATPEQRADVVIITIDWEDAAQGAEIVNRLMDFHLESVDRYRTSKKTSAASGITEQKQIKQAQLDTTTKDLAAWKKEYRIDDPKAQDDKLKSMIRSKEKDRDDAEAKIERLKQEILAAEAKIDELKKEAQKDPNELKLKYGNYPEYKKEEQKLEKDQIEQGGKLKDARTKRPGAESKYSRAKQLFDMQKIVTAAEVAEAKQELESIDNAINLAQQQLRLIEQQQKDLPKLIISQELGVLEKKLGENKNEKIATERLLTSYEDQLRKLKGTEGANLAAKGRTLMEQQEALEKQIDDLDKTIQDLNSLPKEVNIQVQASALSALDAGNTMKKKAIPPFAITFVVLMGLLVGSELKRMLGTTTNVAARMGLPVLSRFALPDPNNRWVANQHGIQAMQSRGLALKLRQFLPENGGTILFTALNPGPEIEDLISDVCRHLTLQDEHVLILDTRITDPQGQVGPPWLDPSILADPTLTGTIDVGLVQYLVFEEQQIGDKIARTRMAKADYLPAGGPCAATDILASQQMRDLLPKLRQRYSVVLMVGPPLSAHIDIEILAGYVDGVVVTLNKPLDKGTDDAVEFVRGLRDLRAPLLGSVLCD